MRPATLLCIPPWSLVNCQIFCVPFSPCPETLSLALLQRYHADLLISCTIPISLLLFRILLLCIVFATYVHECNYITWCFIMFTIYKQIAGWVGNPNFPCLQETSYSTGLFNAVVFGRFATARKSTR